VRGGIRWGSMSGTIRAAGSSSFAPSGGRRRPSIPTLWTLQKTSAFRTGRARGLINLAEEAGLASVDCTAIEVVTVFKDFEDFWHPFTLGAGPAPGYCMSLSPKARQRLREKLHDDLPRQEDGSIRLGARAWAIKAAVA
jgi:hypothetical protein